MIQKKCKFAAQQQTIQKLEAEKNDLWKLVLADALYLAYDILSHPFLRQPDIHPNNVHGWLLKWFYRPRAYLPCGESYGTAYDA